MARSAIALALGLAVASVSTPSNATVIVQYDSEASQIGFDGFNSLMGTLNSVTLDVTIQPQYRDWLLYVPGSTPQARDVQWSINGLYTLWGWSTSGASFLLPDTNIPITGSGSATVQLDTIITPLGEVSGWFTTFAAGSASFSLNPADFVYDILQGQPRIIVTGNDTGYYNSGTDTTFTIAGAHRLIQLGGECNGYQTGDDFCGGVGYRLTYDYTPAGSVPEPATWAMMLLGFGLVGGALRSTRKGISLTLA